MRHRLTCANSAFGAKATTLARAPDDANDPSLKWTVLGRCSAPGSSSAGPSAVAICAVIGGNARKPGVGRLTVEHCLRASLRRQQIATAAIRSIGAVFFH